MTSEIEDASLCSSVLMRCAWSALITTMEAVHFSARSDGGMGEEMQWRREAGFVSFMRSGCYL